MDTFATVTTIRDTFKQTLRFAYYHLGAGAEEVILFFDDASDPAADVLEDVGQVTVIRCGNEYWEESEISESSSIEKRQIHNASAGFDLACRYGYDWVAHIDSDELLFSECELREILTSVNPSTQVVRFKTLEAVPFRYDHESPFNEINTFRVDGGWKRKLWAKRLGCQDAFFEGEYFRGHTIGKSFTRTSATVRKLSVHGPVLGNQHVEEEKSQPQTLFSDGGHVLHFDCCGLDAFRTKWRRRFEGIATAKRMRDSRSRQGEELKRCMGNDEDVSELYERLYFLSGYDRLVLQTLGLIKKINVSIPAVEGLLK